MAVTWSTFADGISLATLRTNLNTFNTSVKNNIDTIEATATSLGSTKISASTTGLLFSALTTAVGQSLTTAYAKVAMVDTNAVSNANGHVAYDTTTKIWTINTTGVYKLSFSGSMKANNNSIVTFNYNTAGASIISAPPEFVGRGNSPVEIGNSFVKLFNAGATFYIEAKADSVITMTPSSCGFTVEKTHY